MITARALIIIEVNQLFWPRDSFELVTVLGCNSENVLLRLLSNGWNNFVPMMSQLCRIWQLRTKEAIS